ncbi:putative RNA-binding Zn ribbon-like protein [Duganella sp. 3397]|uniref:CGNR zinc finger domain-containing protein n=1 Tax=Duganella sp. 3397 TaxID=2817732 RepID=UPI0028618F0A|nr:ABATE domain-containing protein [Duganella sp. 3397]MDR7051243.1 putative RNA-binding Zn ribbon-like protein [Duganella sp. 3397]
MTLTAIKQEAPQVGDHMAMDLLNTEARNDGAAVDYWHSGEEVRAWLARQGVVVAHGQVDSAALHAQAVALRTLARRLIAARKDEEEGGADDADIAALNAYLHAYLGAPHLARGGDGKLALTRTARGDAIASLLGPVAEAVAQLLVEGDFTLVRQCEHPDCILWFYDRTKSHKRRWCSMALCGNRYKAAQFRKKNSQQDSH